METEFFKSFRTHFPVRTWSTSRVSNEDSYWTLDLCKKEAGKYRTREEWEELSPISYQKAIKRKWLTKCTANMVGFKRKPAVQAIWTLERCSEIAAKCQGRAEFKRRFHYQYEKARLNGWLDICCAHMD